MTTSRRKSEADEDTDVVDPGIGDPDAPKPDDTNTTLVMSAEDASKLMEFTSGDIKQFRKLFAFVAALYSKQPQQAAPTPTGSARPEAARGPVIA